MILLALYAVVALVALALGVATYPLWSYMAGLFGAPYSIRGTLLTIQWTLASIVFGDYVIYLTEDNEYVVQSLRTYKPDQDGEAADAAAALPAASESDDDATIEPGDRYFVHDGERHRLEAPGQRGYRLGWARCYLAFSREHPDWQRHLADADGEPDTAETDTVVVDGGKIRLLDAASGEQRTCETVPESINDDQTAIEIRPWLQRLRPACGSDVADQAETEVKAREGKKSIGNTTQLKMAVVWLLVFVSSAGVYIIASGG